MIGYFLRRDLQMEMLATRIDGEPHNLRAWPSIEGLATEVIQTAGCLSNTDGDRKSVEAIEDRQLCRGCHTTPSAATSWRAIHPRHHQSFAKESSTSFSWHAKIVAFHIECKAS